MSISRHFVNTAASSSFDQQCAFFLITPSIVVPKQAWLRTYIVIFVVCSANYIFFWTPPYFARCFAQNDISQNESSSSIPMLRPYCIILKEWPLISLPLLLSFFIAAVVVTNFLTHFTCHLSPWPPIISSSRQPPFKPMTRTSRRSLSFRWRTTRSLSRPLCRNQLGRRQLR